jgi:hypothetical protein
MKALIIALITLSSNALAECHQETRYDQNGNITTQTVCRPDQPPTTYPESGASQFLRGAKQFEQGAKAYNGQ